MSNDLRFAAFWAMTYSAGGMPLTRHFSQRLGAIAAFGAARAGLSPSAVTLLGLGVFAVAAALLATLPGGWGPALLCLALLQAGYALDCADGQVARATGRTSAHGAWLDVACDYLRNLLLAGALSIWLMRSGLPDVLALGCALGFAGGGVLLLHALTVTRQAQSAGALGAARPLALRELAAAALDTPVVLAVIPLLRGHAWLLAAYLAAMGLLNLAAAARQARRLAHG